MNLLPLQDSLPFQYKDTILHRHRHAHTHTHTHIHIHIHTHTHTHTHIITRESSLYNADFFIQWLPVWVCMRK